jgi:hypothetical protein
VNEEEARYIALDIIDQKYQKYCGGNFTQNMTLNIVSPLDVSHVFGIDKSGYTFISNN